MSEEQANPYTAPAVEANESAQTGGVGPHNYATLGQRLLGAIIDGLIMIPLSFGTAFLLFGALAPDSVEGSGFEKFFNQLGALGYLETLIFGLVNIVLFIAVQWTFWKATSQSIGKKVMKTQIVNLDGTPASVNTIAFKRYGIISILVMVIPGNLANLLSLIDSLLIFRSDRNCLHDDIAQTRVIVYPGS